MGIRAGDIHRGRRRDGHLEHHRAPRPISRNYLQQSLWTSCRKTTPPVATQRGGNTWCMHARLRRESPSPPKRGHKSNDYGMHSHEYTPLPPKNFSPPLYRKKTQPADRDDNKPGKETDRSAKAPHHMSRLTTLASSKNSACTRKRRATSHRRSPRTVLNGKRTSSTGTRSGPTSTLTRTVAVPARCRRRTMQTVR